MTSAQNFKVLYMSSKCSSSRVLCSNVLTTARFQKITGKASEFVGGKIVRYMAPPLRGPSESS